jgi:hypothetical protein
MRWGSVFALCSAGILAATAGAASYPASLHLVKLAPFTVRGSGFKPAERVRVTLVFRTTQVRRVVAARTGTFVARFDENVRLSRCSVAFSVRATGGRGTNAALKIPRPACMPARSP